MKIILAECDNGYCGCGCEDVFFYDNDTTDIEIEEDHLEWDECPICGFLFEEG